jgi:hypothetical protein
LRPARLVPADAHHIWRRRMPHSTPPRTRLPQRQTASSASVFPIDPPRVPNVNASRKSAGSATARSGVAAVRAASASQNGDRTSAAAATRACRRWVGFGVIADNLVNIGCAMEKQAAPQLSRHNTIISVEARRSPPGATAGIVKLLLAPPQSRGISLSY